MKAQYDVPECNLSALQAKVDDLNKRARRLGVPEIVIKSVDTYKKLEFVSRAGGSNWISQYSDKLGRYRADYKETGRVRVHVIIEVEGDAPAYAGWHLAATLEPLQTDEGQENIIRTVPGEDIPVEFRTRVGECDHCKAKRRRNETFVVRNDDGEYRMIGRQCLKDFLGHADPHSLASWAELLGAFDKFATEAQDEEYYGGGHAEPEWDLSYFLKVTSAVIRKEGWLSKSKAMDHQTPTVIHVMKYLIPPLKPSNYQRAWRASVAEEIESEVHAKQSDNAIEWAREIDRNIDNDYLYNVSLLARAGYVNSKSTGLAASIISAYRRAHDMEIETGKKFERVESNYVGELKKRMQTIVTVLSVRSVGGGMWGASGMHRMIDEVGNRIVWFASESAEWLEEGMVYEVKMTPKKHEEYKGQKQTTVTRLAVVSGPINPNGEEK